MIVVSGEALMDVFAAGDTDTGLLLDARIGGSPLNVATGLARLGQPAVFFGALSSGFLGDRLLKALQAEGIDTRCTVRSDAPTTLGLVGLDAAGVPSYAFYGTGAADRHLPLSAVDLVPAAAAYHFGSYAMVVEPVAAAQRALVEREHRREPAREMAREPASEPASEAAREAARAPSGEEARSLISYDPNLRLNVEPDIQRWRDTLAWMLPRTHLLKVSDEDLRLLYPGADIGVLAAHWLAAGVALVVVTRGAQGAWAWTAGAHVAAPPVPVPVIDTVGAGDSFQAALLTALAERELLSVAALRTIDAEALNAVLRFAAQAAAITCSRRGADLPRRAELG